MTENNENLDKLLSAFLGATQADEADRDIRAGDEILNNHPVPELADDTIAGLKAEIRSQLSSRRRKRLTLQRVAAAAIIIASVAAVFISRSHGPAQPVIANTSVWQDISTIQDEQIASLAEQIGNIETEMFSIRLGADDSGNGFDLTDIETEINNINGNFWKG
jgi:hypothetical protein